MEKKLAQRLPTSLCNQGYASIAFAVGIACSGLTCAGTGAAGAAEPISIPLKHVSSQDDKTVFSSLGIMIGVNGSKPRLFQFDTGSDDLLAQIDTNIPGVRPVPGGKPDIYPYGDGSYGYWMQTVQFENLSYYDPKDPSGNPVATLAGKYAAGQILDWVRSKKFYGFKDHKMSDKAVGTHDGSALYVDLEVRERIRNGEPGDSPPFYGTFGAGNFIQEKGPSTALGAQTKTGYVISANANMGNDKTPGCAPCLMLNLTPNVRSQFTALMPWGKLDYDDYLPQFDQSGANASNEHEGSYNFTISVEVGKKKRAVELMGPILFDTGTSNFIFLDRDDAVKKLRAKGFKLDEFETGNADFKLHGFADKLNDLEFDDIDVYRMDDEEEGAGVTIGIPFFQSNAMMYDLENRTTAYSPYFVTVDDFTTDAANNGANHLSRVSTEIGSAGWLGLAGNISGAGDFTIEKDTNVRMSGTNTYTGVTHVAADSSLYLAGPGSIEQSSRITVDGMLNIEQKGDARTAWGVSGSMNDVAFRDLGGKGDIYLGSHKLILTAANGQFDGSMADIDDVGKSMGGSLVLAGGKLTLGGQIDYSGLTEVLAGAELHVKGSLTGDVSVSGKLIVDGEVDGTVTVKSGGWLGGGGKVGDVHVLAGGNATKMKAMTID